MATSGEFCLAADGAPTDCESVQFISGVELQDAQTLLLAYGPSLHPNSDPNPNPNPDPDPDRLYGCRRELVSPSPTPDPTPTPTPKPNPNPNPNPHPHPSYGVNDCAAKVARLALERVWRMLRPLAAHAGDACYATSDIAEGI